MASKQALAFFFLALWICRAALGAGTPLEYDITTIAGVSPGYANGTGSAARFNGPNGVALDTAGNVVVADSFNHVIRRISAAGVVSTIAGTYGQAGFADGTPNTAQFNDPCALTVDGQGDIFVADTLNFVVRKIDPRGLVTTVAGVPGQFGYVNGSGSTVRFGYLAGICLDSLGNIYVTDLSSCTVRKIDRTGVVSTFAGHPSSTLSADGTGLQAGFIQPSGLAIDANNNLFVLDIAGFVREISPQAAVTTVADLPFSSVEAGAFGNGGQFAQAAGIAVDNQDNLYVSYQFSDVIERISASGVMTNFAGTPGVSGHQDGPASSALFLAPAGLAVDETGNVTVADRLNCEIRRISSDGVVTTIAGAAPRGVADGIGSSARFALPAGTALDSSGNIYVADSEAGTIRKIAPSGAVSTIAGIPNSSGYADGPAATAQFVSPHALVVAPSGVIYVADNEDIRRIGTDGSVTTLAGINGAPGLVDGQGEAARFNEPDRMALDANGNLYVCDVMNGEIRKVSPSGSVMTVSIPWPAQDEPRGIAINPQGIMYILDQFNNVVYDFDPVHGSIGVFAGQFGTAGYADGTGEAALFNNPTDLALDGSGNLYVADSNNEVLRRIASDGAVTTIAGTPGIAGNVDGTGFGARFNDFDGDPSLAADTAGNIYLSDPGNNVIRCGVPTTKPPPGAWLMNASVEGVSEGAGQPVQAGFVVSGPFPKRLLVRGVGPTLSQFGLSDVLADPTLQLYDGTVQAPPIVGWTGLTEDSFESVGAFALMPGSLDAAEFITFNPGIYTVSLAGAEADSGIALFELYDADGGAPTSRIAEASGRGMVNSDNGFLIGGFVIAGSGTKNILIRAVGPTLSAYGVNPALAHPSLSLYAADGQLIGGNVGWTNPPWTTGGATVTLSPASGDEMASVGAFPLTMAGDSAFVASLSPGAYTAIVSGTDGDAGEALLEIYEAP